MAADLSTVGTSPLISRSESIPVTWLEFKAPTWAAHAEFIPEGDAYIGWAGHDGASSETPADGQAVGTHRLELASEDVYKLRLRAPRDEAHPDARGVRSVFMAGQTGTIKGAVVFHVEGGE